MEVLGRYSNLRDQDERVHVLLEMTPAGPRRAKVRTPRQAQRRLTADEVHYLVSQYRAGSKVTEIAAFFGLHRDTVSEVLNRQAVPRRQRGVSPDLVGEVIASYQSGSSLATIGAKLSVDPGTVALALRRASISLRPRRGWSR